MHKHPIMKKEITRLICAAICCTPIIGFAQTGDKFTSTDNLYKEGKELFQERNYAAALPALKAFVKQKPSSQPSSGRRVYAGQFGLRTERQKPTSNYLRQ